MKRFEIDKLLDNGVDLSIDAIEELAEYSGVGVFNLHIPTGEIKLNKNITQLTGYDFSELPHNKNTREMLTFENDRARVNKYLNSIINGEIDRYQIEYRMRRKDNSLVSVLESAIIYERDENGKPVSLIGLSRDLSRLRWAEEKARDMEKENKRLAAGASASELAEQNRMLRATNYAARMIIGGFHQDYEMVLRQSLQILGESVLADRAYIWRNIEIDSRLHCYARAEWCNDGYYPITEIDNMIAYDKLFYNWKDRFMEQTSIRTLAKELPACLRIFPGINNAKSIMIAPIYLNGEFWGLLRFDDCTNERVFTEIEAEIMISGAMVIASSISRNETFGKLNEAREEAMASTKAKGEFLSRMSHEIRTPMNAIIGMSAIAKKTSDYERIKYCLDKIDVSSHQLLSIINDVLDMSKIDSGKFDIVNNEFDFEKMLQNVINVIQVKFDEKHQNFHINFNIAFNHNIISDELRLSQVLINLLTNASKFTPEGGKVTLEIEQTQLDNNRLKIHIDVEDNGIGISQEQQKKLFQSFEQADGSITRAYGGTGLGLAICKKIIELMGGTIWIESDLGQGAHFIFEVEVFVGEEILANGTEQTTPENIHILVVDDAEDVREYFKNILTDFSFTCDVAGDGKEAVELVQLSLYEEKPYDMVFVDWNMPGMNGGETASKIRELMNNDVVVVMISVADWTDIEKDAKKHGINNFLSKPVLPNILYNTIIKLSEHTDIATPNNLNKIVNLHNKTILLAEDIEINREIVHNILSETGAVIIDAVDGEEAVNLFSSSPEKYDLILMDMQMPKLDGLGATKQIRKLNNIHAKKIPIFAMTANAFKEDAQMCIEAGMNAHLAKPLDLDILFETLAMYFEK